MASASFLPGSGGPAGTKAETAGEHEVGTSDGLSILVDAGDRINLKLAVVALRVVFDLRLGDVGQGEGVENGGLECGNDSVGLGGLLQGGLRGKRALRGGLGHGDDPEKTARAGRRGPLR